jgi:hypothetical protein
MSKTNEYELIINVNNNEEKQVNSLHSQPCSKTSPKFCWVIQSIGSSCKFYSITSSLVSHGLNN